MDRGYQTLAARYINRQAKQLAKQLAGVRAAEDTEFVHRARVATRRLRAALRMFDECFSAKDVRRWRKAIRRITSSLGGARDRDVQIESLCGMLSALNVPACFPGVARVLASWERDRERRQRQVVKAVDRIEADGTLRDMRRAAMKILKQSDPLPNPPAVETCVRIEHYISRRVDALLGHQESLGNPEDRLEHHAMRIALKRVRYSVEISRPLYPGRLDVSLATIKRLQTLLGEVHDCDVWLDQLDVFAKTERKRIVAMFGHAGRFQHLSPGIEYLQEDLRLRRRLAFQQLVNDWAELARDQFWDELRAIVGGRGPSSLS